MTVKEFNEKIDAAVAKIAEELKSTEEAIRMATSDISTATEEMDAAMKTGNEKKYSAAKAKKLAAIDKKEMSIARRAYIKDEPQISKEEYESIISAVRITEAERCLEAKRRFIDLIEQALAICKEDAECACALDAAAQRWQSEVYRNADNRRRNAEGKWQKIHNPTNKWYGDMALAKFLQDVRSHTNYDAIAAAVSAGNQGEKV